MKRLPKFKSEEEEACFWDTHSPLDYPDEFTEVKEPFKIAPSFSRLSKGERAKLKTLSLKEKGQEKPVTKKFIENLKRGKI